VAGIDMDDKRLRKQMNDLMAVAMEQLATE